MRFRSLLIALALVAHGRQLEAQYQTRSWLEWRTIDAGRFALHFPVELEPWARTVASRIVGIDSAVSRITGFRPPQRIDVVMDDPFRIPNGSAWPLIDEPALVLWATPPSPREDVGTYVSWADMLATHEFAHLSHLLRPTRNAFQSLLWKLAPVELGPISRKAPRWLIEGYATHIEGRITGSGRPHGVWRPTILRQWAIEGMLPTYAQLDGMSGMYGGDFAYLAGSSFIEWLTARHGDGTLVALWRRMSARRDRGFSEAFTGVYGEPPDVLYGRFAAELIAASKRMEVVARRSPGDSGTIIQHLARETGDPAISHDGGRAAIMLASATRPGRVVIWTTIPEPDSATQRAARALLSKDPEDVAPIRVFPAPKRALATLHPVGNQPYQDPRFFRDGRVLVWRNTAVGDGSWMPDLYAWDPQRRSVERLTSRANVRNGDPSPDGSLVAATRCESGTCDLVLLDLRSREVMTLVEGSDTRSFHRPRFSPNGTSIALSMRTNGVWQIGLFDLSTRSLEAITSGPVNHFDPSFVDDSTVVATADGEGVLNIVQLRTDGSVVGRMTSVTGAAVAPVVNPADGAVWFLALHARGWDVRAARGIAAAALTVPVTRAAGEVGGPRLLAEAPTSPSRKYSPDRKWVYFPGGSVVHDGAGVVLGLANTDPAGKLELLVQAANSLRPASLNAPMEGAAVSLTRRSRVSQNVAAFALRHGGPLAQSTRGGSAWLELPYRVERFSLRATAGATWSRARGDEQQSPAGHARWFGFAEGSASMTRFREGKRTTGQLTLHGAEGRRGDSRIGRVLGTGSLTSTEIPLSFTAQFGIVATTAAPERFIIGGSPPTLAPPAVFAQHIVQPALPPVFDGKRLETYRLSAPFGAARLYAWLGRAYDDGQPPPFERVIGVEWSASIAPIAVLGTPAARATIGAGRWLNRRDAFWQAPGDPAIRIAPKPPLQFYLTTQFGDWAR